MTTGMLQDPPSTSAGPRFRPYASPCHHVTKGRYITSNDPRGYIPVYEYPLNGQWIMMDIDDGYILWTGIWKALGNSKADIVKMIDSQPDLAPLIRRVRGGYLKIQGTWMPYEVALKLSRRVAWAIRDDLVPLFGPTFPSTCLSPDQPGYGQVVPSGQGRRRARRSTQSSVGSGPVVPRSSAGATNWTVVTPSSSSTPNTQHQHHAAHYGGSRENLPHALYPLQRPSEFAFGHVRRASSSDGTGHPTGSTSGHLHSPTISHCDSSRYPSIHGPPPSSYRKPVSPMMTKRMSLSIDIRSLSMSDSSSSRPGPQQQDSDITLPPVMQDDSRMIDSPYALPPISAMEDLRGTVTQDSAAVLRRLQRDDSDEYPRAAQCQTQRGSGAAPSQGGDYTVIRRHSLSAHPTSTRLSDTSPRFQPYAAPRSYQDHSSSSIYRSRSPPSAYRSGRRDSIRGRLSDTSTTHEGDYSSNASPTSPSTPNSIISDYSCVPAQESRTARGVGHGDCYAPNVNPSVGFHGYSLNGRSGAQKTVESQGTRISDLEAISARRRHSFEAHSDGDSGAPHRPW